MATQTENFSSIQPSGKARSLSLGTLVLYLIRFLVIGGPIAIMILLIFYPLAAIILQSVFPKLYAPQPEMTLHLEIIGEVMGQKHTYSAIFNTLWVSSITVVVTCVLGTLLAILTERTDLPGHNIFRVLIWVVFFTPSYMLGEAWILILIKGSLPDQYLHFSKAFIETFLSPLGVILVLSLKGFPIVYLSVSAALHRLGSEFEEAAHVAGARPLGAWLRINLPLLLPAILAGGLLTFADSIADFGTAATIAQNASVPLVTYQLYRAVYSSPVDFAQAAVLSLLLFLLTILALFFQSRLLRRRSFQVISGRTRPAQRVSLKRWKVVALLFCLIVFTLALFFPATISVLTSFTNFLERGLAPSNLTLANYQHVLTVVSRGGEVSQVSADSEGIAALSRSFILSLAAATLATLVGLPIAFIIRRTRLPGRSVLSFLTVATVAVPGLVLACGYIFAWNAPILAKVGIGTANGFRIYGTLWGLLFVYVASGLPLAARLGIGAIDQIGESLLDSARVQGANIFQLLVNIVAPLMSSSLISTWLLVFSGSMFALATSELLYPPGQPTAAVVIIKYFNDLRYAEGMALTVLTVIAVGLMLAVLRAVPWIIGRLLRRRALALTRRSV
jgi:iron(III) transport system permease protein